MRLRLIENPTVINGRTGSTGGGPIASMHISPTLKLGTIALLVAPPPAAIVVPQVTHAIQQQNFWNAQVRFAQRITSYMEAKGYRLSKTPGTYNIIYVTGMNEDGTPNDDRLNTFNDRRILLTFLDGKTPDLAGNWEASTTPGKDYYSGAAPDRNPKGTAFVKEGQWLNGWKIGWHKKPNHIALEQVGEIVVLRDNKRPDSGLFGINQHGGYDYPIDDVGNTSAGCLVGRTMQGQQEFMNLLRSDKRAKANPDFRFDTTIIKGTDLK